MCQHCYSQHPRQLWPLCQHCQHNNYDHCVSVVIIKIFGNYGIDVGILDLSVMTNFASVSAGKTQLPFQLWPCVLGDHLLLFYYDFWQNFFMCS